MNLLKKNFALTILVAALGNFVDVYDIVLFTAVRVQSLKDLGITGDALTATGLYLMNIQLFGMLIGGIIWGIIGDKHGRLSVLFGSIILYSIANLANGFVTDIWSYAALRFIAGFGLAGELGAGVTLVSELMPKEKRGYGIIIIAATGIFGGVAAGVIGDRFTWRNAYIIGGVMGFALLFLRSKVRESGLFCAIQNKKIKKGDLRMFVKSPQLLGRYVRCLCVGLPIWVFIGFFITLAPEIGKIMNIQGDVSAGKAILFYNIGIGCGDIGSGILSQYLKSRKKAAMFFLCMVSIFILPFFFVHNISLRLFYSFYGFLGFGAGFWVIFIMMTSEQFGTNLRSTVTTSIPNLVRGMVIPLTVVLTFLKPHLGLLWGIGVITFTVMIAAFMSLYSLKETFSTSLDYVEK